MLRLIDPTNRIPILKSLVPIIQVPFHLRLGVRRPELHISSLAEVVIETFLRFFFIELVFAVLEVCFERGEVVGDGAIAMRVGLLEPLFLQLF